MKTLINEILEFKKLDDNWDGHGAIPPEEPVIYNSLRFINLCKNVEKVTDYYPNTNGTITFEFENKEKLIFLEIGNKTMSYFVQNIEDEVTYYDKVEITDGEVNKLSKLIEKV